MRRVVPLLLALLIGGVVAALRGCEVKPLELIELRAYDKRRPVAAGEACPVSAKEAEHKVSLMITAPGTYTLYLLGRSDTQAKKDSADVRIEKQLVVK